MREIEVISYKSTPMSLLPPPLSKSMLRACIRLWKKKFSFKHWLQTDLALQRHAIIEGRALRVEQTTRALVSMVTTRPQIADQVSCSVLFLYKIIPFPIIYCHYYVVILFLHRLTFVLETLVSCSYTKVCLPHLGGFTCVCTAGFTGTYCTSCNE